ncbi:MAG: DUF885 family protein [Desulfobacteraceae bacterium]|jgi:hypothetical protein
MQDKEIQVRDLSLIAEDYFGYMGRHFPQQCASDEFYFFPRSEEAIQYLDTLDALEPGTIQDRVQYVQNLLREVASKAPENLEEEIDLVLLKQSMGSFVLEFGEKAVWRGDPTLYVKIPLFATGRLLSQEGRLSEGIRADLLTLFTQIPSFLRQAVKNLSRPSEISVEVALNMSRDALYFYEQSIPPFILEKMGQDNELLTRSRAVSEAWRIYMKGLADLSARQSFAVGEDGLKEILDTCLCYPKSPNEILETAKAASDRTGEKLHALSKRIDSRKRWDVLVYERRPSITSSSDFMALYENQVKDLRRFFYEQEILSFPHGEDVTVLQTPAYLQSLRATASYSAPITGSRKSHGVFYLTPGKEDLAKISAHCPYLSAHETYPGHHILDHLRIHHPNPIRRQVESPLFYEGWACYAEQLLDELGYVQDLRQQLIGLKRQLWRNLRAELDIKLQTGRISLDQAAREIEDLGFSRQRAERQIRRFALTPGYQLCYFMGNHEIVELREQFSSRLGQRAFHDTLLGGGEIPFHLVERKLKERMNEAG